MPRKPKEVKADDGGPMSNKEAKTRVRVNTDRKTLNEVVQAMSAPTPGPPDEGGALNLAMPSDDGQPKRNVPLIDPEAGGHLIDALRGYDEPAPKTEKLDVAPRPKRAEVNWQFVLMAGAGVALGAYLLYKFVYKDNSAAVAAAAAEVSPDVSYALPTAQ